MAIRNKLIRQALAADLKTRRESHKKILEEMRLNATIVDQSLKKLSKLGLEWFGTEMLYFRVSGTTKAEFSAQVEKIALALGEPPSIQVDHGMLSRSEYIANFEESRVHVFLLEPTDCQFIEEEITQVRKVLKPHPSCVQALRVLEDIA